jgi:hypothetical protein
MTSLDDHRVRAVDPDCVRLGSVHYAFGKSLFWQVSLVPGHGGRGPGGLSDDLQR